ncbi:LysR family transcriptional regulator [Bordetella pseudohinzii]|uniref:CysJI operon transcriptional activator n=1 Tax=Bordetella pseudohinzii TaxID=1331258 RepID=A0A0J6CCU4_9BORD|nr:LysR family transcriptional regulator [Bordetella pseudohinzii]ANY16322.1 LysR family transcriptional regulator [Bordetella pseudohinzii]KMM27452.1 LysR family transcriptional regulator [Bordetella pseudohinzii]KXA78458.1 LysR family transcriptional regulator [Bordetella pseudohinzii]KXA80639.1 LysR family transcriptional regulator [Bordetella pseudohinzii]CUI39859.1 CysJI operon transcriptional activator [Bordetella pseudohinzii]
MATHFDLTDLQLMVHIGDWHSLTRAAEKSHLSLPAASTRVKNLEEHFGTQLLYRNSQGVTLTPSGEALTRHARTVMQQIEQLRGDMQEFARGVKGHVRVLANTTASTEFMPAVLARYLAVHPDVNVELRERLSYLIVRAVADGSADIGVVAGCAPDPKLQFIPYRSDRLVLVTASRHPLAGEDAVPFADTLGFDYVGLSEWSAIHPFLVQAAAALGRTFRFRIEVGNFEAACRMIESGVGIGVIPESVALRYARVLDIAVVPLTDEWSVRQLHICVRDLEALPVFARELVQTMIDDIPEDEIPA